MLCTKVAEHIALVLRPRLLPASRVTRWLCQSNMGFTSLQSQQQLHDATYYSTDSTTASSSSQPVQKPDIDFNFQQVLSPAHVKKQLETLVPVSSYDKFALVLVGKYSKMSEVPDRIPAAERRALADRFRVAALIFKVYSSPRMLNDYCLLEVFGWTPIRFLVKAAYLVSHQWLRCAKHSVFVSDRRYTLKFGPNNASLLLYDLQTENLPEDGLQITQPREFNLSGLGALVQFAKIDSTYFSSVAPFGVGFREFCASGICDHLSNVRVLELILSFATSIDQICNIFLPVFQTCEKLTIFQGPRSLVGCHPPAAQLSTSLSQLFSLMPNLVWLQLPATYAMPLMLKNQLPDKLSTLMVTEGISVESAQRSADLLPSQCPNLQCLGFCYRAAFEDYLFLPEFSQLRELTVCVHRDSALHEYAMLQGFDLEQGEAIRCPERLASLVRLELHVVSQAPDPREIQNLLNMSSSLKSLCVYFTNKLSDDSETALGNFDACVATLHNPVNSFQNLEEFHIRLPRDTSRRISTMLGRCFQYLTTLIASQLLNLTLFQLDSSLLGERYPNTEFIGPFLHAISISPRLEILRLRYDLNPGFYSHFSELLNAASESATLRRIFISFKPSSDIAFGGVKVDSVQRPSRLSSVDRKQLRDALPLGYHIVSDSKGEVIIVYKFNNDFGCIGNVPNNINNKENNNLLNCRSALCMYLN